MWSHVRHPHDCLSHEGESHCYALSKSSNCSKVQDTCLQPTIVCAICSIAGVDHLFHGARILVWRYLGCEAQIRPFPLLDLLPAPSYSVPNHRLRFHLCQWHWKSQTGSWRTTNALWQSTLYWYMEPRRSSVDVRKVGDRVSESKVLLSNTRLKVLAWRSNRVNLWP